MMRIRKIYYVPGLISLLGLPILLLFIGPEDVVTPYAISMAIPSDKKDPEGIRFSKEGVFRTIKDKNIITIDLDVDRIDMGGNENADFIFNRKCKLISEEFDRLQLTNDTNTVLKIQLGEKNDYGDFIWILNHALIYRVKRYALVDNDFYFLSNPPIIHYPPEAYYPPANDFILHSIGKKLTEWDFFVLRFEAKIKELGYLIRHNRIYLAAFLVFVIIPGIFFIKRNFHLTRLSSSLKPIGKEI